jgi:threonine/homoserine/homoserine lactone efflux protein
MTLDSFLALVLFAFVASVTPGPNNLMLLSSGVNFGFRRSLPHIFGISGGIGLLYMAVGLGLGALISAYPALHLALKVAGAAYLLFLAWRLATLGSIEEKGAGNGRPMTFLEALAFQWVNPKAWVVGMTAVALYADPAMPFLSSLLVVAAFTLVNIPSVSAWAAFGTALRGFLSDPGRLRGFNIVMAILLAATLWPMLR